MILNFAPNAELSCAAESNQPRIEFTTEYADPNDMLGDNCSDLLSPSMWSIAFIFWSSSID
jgi:hypothetical protein